MLLNTFFRYFDLILKDSVRYAVAEWYGAGLCDREVAGSRLPPVAAVYQRQLSVQSLRGRLMSTSESWRVNGHNTRCTGPVSVVLQLQLVSG